MPIRQSHFWSFFQHLIFGDDTNNVKGKIGACVWHRYINARVEMKALPLLEFSPTILIVGDNTNNG